ncbi:MAG: tRNA (adenosine(37)-N6)-threonylcarbamoyltransferase complex ATPase subunit type 1 TsaE [bacterium]|nr:tRNA (adenosine(37)-N6)-threonylcarbamoyltransferase complex ATPase subunit type 1 TsaE [bacterium]
MERDFKTALEFFSSLEVPRRRGLKLALDGNLGAGKTHFVRALLDCWEPGLSAQAASPSFGLCHNYVGSALVFDHFDLYRLEDRAELEETGLFESLSDPNRVTLVEWAELFPEVYRFCNLRLWITEEGKRRHYQIQQIEV